jgi:glycosyltransferase involved in cell wall biosynthesis
MNTRNLKIIHVIARLNVGGTSRYLCNLLPKLEKSGIDYILAVGNVQNGEIEDSNLEGLNFRRINSMGRAISLIKDARASLEIYKIIRLTKPDVIHSHTFKAGLLCRLIFPKIPKVHTFHGHLLTDPEFTRFQLKMIITVEKFLAQFTKKFIVTGNQVSVDLFNSGIGIENQYISIPGELDEMSFRPRAEVRNELELDNSFTIIWVARIAPVKQPDLVLEVAKLCPDFSFIICGDGPDLENLRSRAPSNVKFLGMVNPERYLKAADIFLSTSANEGIPYSILEAQASGLPVVAINSGAVSEIVEDGVNGYLTSGQAEEIALRISELNMNPILRIGMSASGLLDSGVKPHKPRSVDLHLKVYREVMGQRLEG